MAWEGSSSKLIKLFISIFIFLIALYIFLDVVFNFSANMELAVKRLSPGWGAALLIVGFLTIDVLVPVPSSIIMVASGALFGPVLGGILSTFGSSSCAIIAFQISRKIGREKVRRWVGQKDYKNFSALMQKHGGYVVILTRAVPLIMESVSFIAGLTKMKLKNFILMNIIGFGPFAFLYSFAGASMKEAYPLSIVLILGFFLPICLWAVVLKFTKFTKLQEKKKDTENLPQLWGEYAQAGYEKLYKSYSFKKILKIMASMFSPSPRGLVLDGGCGTGNMFEAIIKGINPKTIVATDWSDDMLKKARLKAKKLSTSFRFEKMDMLEPFPYSDNNFDAGVFNLSICYLPSKEGWKHVMKEAFRTTKPGGYVYISTFLKGWDFSEMLGRNKLRASKEALASPIGIYYGIKLKKYPERITKITKEKGMEYPGREELNSFIKNEVGFKVVEEKEIFWGAGVVLKLQKPTPL